VLDIVLLSAAHIHTKGYLQTIGGRDDCRLVAVWDDVPDRGRRYAAEAGAQFVAELEAAVQWPGAGAFLICAENARHLPLLEAAIPRRLPIFCEKPLLTTTAATRRVLELVRVHGTIVHAGYTQPFGDVMQGVAALLGEGRLGHVTHARFRNAHHAAYGRWFDAPDLAWFHALELAGGGAFMDMGTHAVHLLRTLLGPVTEVLATIRNASGEYPQVDDHGIALLRFASGVLGVVEAAWIQTGGSAGLEITGSQGTVFQHPERGYVLAAPGQPPVPVAPALARPVQVARLVAAAAGQLPRAELDADLRCAADAVAIMEACYASSASGHWEPVPALVR